jgi:hypothetical protein
MVQLTDDGATFWSSYQRYKLEVIRIPLVNATEFGEWQGMFARLRSCGG